MNKLKTSTKVLIALAASAIVLAVVLLLTMPEPWTESIKEHHALIMDGSFKRFDSESDEDFHRFYKSGRPGNYYKSPVHFGGFLILAVIILFIFRRKGFHGRRDHSRAIMDQLYATEKITEEEYRRRRTVIEEEEK